MKSYKSDFMKPIHFIVEHVPLKKVYEKALKLVKKLIESCCKIESSFLKMLRLEKAKAEKFFILTMKL